MTKRQKVAAASAMRDSGLTYREIGEAFGVHLTAVYRWLHPHDPKWKRAYDRAYKSRNRERLHAQDRAYRLANRGTCLNCDEPMGASARRKDGICAGCRGRLAAMKRELLAERWKAGQSAKEIAAALGTTAGTVYVQVGRMREAGWDLPHRQPFGR